MKRRDLLAGLFAMAAGGPFWCTFRPRGTLALVPRVAQAAAPGGTLLAIFLRGGLDGLHAVAPCYEEAFYRLRPRLSPPPGACLDLDGRFGLHPALQPLLPLYREGSLAVVHGVGTPEASRSHFVAQDFLEAGGWMNRLGRGLSTTQRLPALLRGPSPVASVPSLESLDVPLVPLEREIARLDPAGYRPAAAYPAGPLADQLRMVAFLLKSGVALEAVHAEMAGFDTHALQVDPQWPGAPTGLNALLDHLAVSLAAFWADLGALGERVTVVTLTEFGRRVAENGSAGTDHGRGTCCFVLGGRVRGGRVLGRVPRLEEDALEDGMDLPVTTDYRDVLVEVTGVETLFEGYQPSAGPGLAGGPADRSTQETIHDPFVGVDRGGGGPIHARSDP